MVCHLSRLGHLLMVYSGNVLRRNNRSLVHCVSEVTMLHSGHDNSAMRAGVVAACLLVLSSLILGCALRVGPRPHITTPDRSMSCASGMVVRLKLSAGRVGVEDKTDVLVSFSNQTDRPMLIELPRGGLMSHIRIRPLAGTAPVQWKTHVLSEYYGATTSNMYRRVEPSSVVVLSARLRWVNRTQFNSSVWGISGDLDDVAVLDTGREYGVMRPGVYSLRFHFLSSSAPHNGIKVGDGHWQTPEEVFGIPLVASPLTSDEVTFELVAPGVGIHD